VTTGSLIYLIDNTLDGPGRQPSRTASCFGRMREEVEILTEPFTLFLSSALSRFALPILF